MVQRWGPGEEDAAWRSITQSPFLTEGGWRAPAVDFPEGVGASGWGLAMGKKDLPAVHDVMFHPARPEGGVEDGPRALHDGPAPQPGHEGAVQDAPPAALAKDEPGEKSGSTAAATAATAATIATIAAAAAAAAAVAPAAATPPPVSEALGDTPVGRLHAAVKAALGPGPGSVGQGAATPLAPGQSMPLKEVLMQAPVMTQGKGELQKTVDQAAAALATAQNALGIDDPENVRVTAGADGTYSLSRAGAAGAGAGAGGAAGVAEPPFARVDAQHNRITLVPGPDGSYSQAALNLAWKSTPHGMPVYLPGGEPPLSPAEVGSLMEKGQQATGSAQDRAQADAALTQAGLSPEGIGRLVQQGRLSVQDGKLLNDKFNGGVTSYATRQAGEAAQQQEADQQKLYEAAKGTPEQPNFQSWMDRGDPQRDAQVQARAKELGVSEDALRRDLETRRVLDWSTPLTQQSHDLQSGLTYGLGRKLGFIDRAEPTRMLPDGSIMPDPELGGDRAEFDAAIAGSHGSEEAKARARGQWDRYHDNYLTNVRPSLETMETLPGVENYTAWRERVQEEGKVAGFSENQKAEMYMNEQKGRDGFVKFLDNVSSNLLAGSHDLVAGIAGTAGLLTGSQTASEYAAEKSGEARRTTEALQHTGNDGALSTVVGGLARAAPGLAAAAATGGTVGGAAVAFTQGAGSTYAELYQHHVDKGLTPEEAHKAAFGASAASGAFSAALGKILPGGASALNNPATRELAKKSFGTAVRSFLKGAAHEVPEELLDSGFNHFAAEVNKGATFKEAAQSFITQLPETMATAGAMGGTVQTGSHLREGRGGGGGSGSNATLNVDPPGITQAPAPLPVPQGQSQTQPGQASTGPMAQADSPAPAPPPAQNGQATAGAQDPGAAAPARPEPVSPPAPAKDPAVGDGQPQPPAVNTQKDAEAVDAPPSLPGDTTTPPAVDSKDSPQAAAAPAAAKAKPSQPPLSADRSRTLIKNVEAITAHRPLNPVEQADLDQAKKVVAQDTVRGLEQKAQDNGGQLDAADTQALAEARAQAGETDTAARQSPSDSQAAGKPATPNGVNPSADTTSPAAPPGRGGGRPSGPASPRIPDAGTPGPAAPARPSRPPLSMADSKKLIANVAKMPAPARQHPTVQADLAQAQRVVVESAGRGAQFEAAPASATQASGPAQASSPAIPLPKPVLPAATGRIGDVEAQLQGVAAQWDKLRQDFEMAQLNEKAAAINGSNAEFLKARKDLVKAENAVNQMIEDARRIVAVPQAVRGQVAFGTVDSRLRSAVQAGARLAESYTHAALLPKLDVAHRASERPAYGGGVVHMDESATESEIMHEITHGTEVQNPAVLAAAVAFLQHRAGTEQPQLLSKLTGDSRYRADEYAYEDQFAVRGGVHYMGKDYRGGATEILTRGIERLHNDPVEFMQNDPEYFRFILQTLQQP